MQLLWQREVCNRVSGKKRRDPKQVPKWQEMYICFSGSMAAGLAMIKIKWPSNDKEKVQARALAATIEARRKLFFNFISLKFNV